MFFSLNLFLLSLFYFLSFLSCFSPILFLFFSYPVPFSFSYLFSFCLYHPFFLSLCLLLPLYLSRVLMPVYITYKTRCFRSIVPCDIPIYNWSIILFVHHFLPLSTSLTFLHFLDVSVFISASPFYLIFSDEKLVCAPPSPIHLSFSSLFYPHFPQDPFCLRLC